MLVLLRWMCSDVAEKESMRPRSHGDIASVALDLAEAKSRISVARVSFYCQFLVEVARTQWRYCYLTRLEELD